MPNRLASYCKPFAVAISLLASAAAWSATVSVTVDGVSGELRDNVVNRLAIRQLAKQDQVRSRTIRRLHRRANEDIEQALRPFGYYNPVIDARLDVADDGKRHTAHYNIDPGPPTTLRSIDIAVTGAGANEGPIEDARAAIDLRVDARLRHPLYRQTKSALRDAAYRLGYLDATYTRQRLAVDPAINRADIELTLDTGPAYTFGPITVEQDILDDDVIRRYIGITQGERFNATDLVDMQLGLSELGYFSQVQVDANRDAAQDHAIPVTVLATPRAAQRYEAGIGYGTDTGARLSARTEFRHLNRRGHQLNLDFQISEVINTLTSQYIIPVGTEPGETFSLSAGAEDERLEDGDRRTVRLEASRNWQLGEWYRRYYLQFLREDFIVGDTEQISILLTPGVSLTRTEVDDPVYARQGWSVFFDIHGAAEEVLSETSFVQSRVQLQGVLPVFDRGRLLLRTEVGGTVIDDFDALPPSERFFAGGDASVRGYGFESLGPRNDEGRVIGGEFLLTGSVEYEQLIWRGLGLAVFVDGGNADDDGFPELVYGAGVGVRYRSPVGVIRVDVAHPFDDPDRAVRLHLGIRAGL